MSSPKEMLLTKNNNSSDQNQNSIPTTTNNNIPEVPILLQAIAYFYLTLNSISTIHQAYTHGDFSMVAFIVFVYFGHFCLMYCMNQLHALPPLENSPRKDFLKFVIWVLTSVVLFGFAHQFSTFIHPVAAVFVFVLAIIVTSFLFYLYFVYDHGGIPHHHHHQQRRNQAGYRHYRLRIKILRVSSPTNQVSDNKTRQVVSGPENV